MEPYALPVYRPQHTALQTIFGGLKLATFIGSALLAAMLISSSIHANLSAIKLPTPLEKSTIASIPMKYINFPDIGNVATPHIETTVNDVPITFLIDTGAKISALPLAYVEKLGIDTTTSKRIYLRSATNNTTYGYLSEIVLQMNQTQMTVPVVFAEVIEPLLGTYGFFDTYTVLFENGKNIIIKEKS